jgi:hypothetical protein
MIRPNLPPLNAIKAFEAAARLGSFTRAAEELKVTHGAVSRQIRVLEDWLGARLFLRTSRNAVPTRAGADLLAEASPALDRLANASHRARGGTGGLQTRRRRKADSNRWSRRDGKRRGIKAVDLFPWTKTRAAAGKWPASFSLFCSARPAIPCSREPIRLKIGRFHRALPLPVPHYIGRTAAVGLGAG